MKSDCRHDHDNDIRDFSITSVSGITGVVGFGTQIPEVLLTSVNRASRFDMTNPDSQRWSA